MNITTATNVTNNLPDIGGVNREMISGWGDGERLFLAAVAMVIISGDHSFLVAIVTTRIVLQKSDIIMALEIVGVSVLKEEHR